MIITVDDFKQYFTRDFPYLPTYTAGKVYFKGDEVYVAPNFYQSLIDNNTAAVTDTTAWKAVNDSVDGYLSDFDIEKAIGEATLNFNEELFSEDDAAKKIPFLYLVAYYLVIDIKNGMAGLGSSAYASYIGSKSVGNVSESYAIPSWVQNDPTLGLYMDNGYGKKYLTLVLPRITGFIYLARGGTTLG